MHKLNKFNEDGWHQTTVEIELNTKTETKKLKQIKTNLINHF